MGRSVGSRSWAGPYFSIPVLEDTELFWNLALKGRDAPIGCPLVAFKLWISPRILSPYVQDPHCRISLHVLRTSALLLAGHIEPGGLLYKPNKYNWRPL